MRIVLIAAAGTPRSRPARAADRASSPMIEGILGSLSRNRMRFAGKSKIEEKERERERESYQEGNRAPVSKATQRESLELSTTFPLQLPRQARERERVCVCGLFKREAMPPGCRPVTRPLRSRAPINGIGHFRPRLQSDSCVCAFSFASCVLELLLRCIKLLALGR